MARKTKVKVTPAEAAKVAGTLFQARSTLWAGRATVTGAAVKAGVGAMVRRTWEMVPVLRSPVTRRRYNADVQKCA